MSKESQARDAAVASSLCVSDTPQAIQELDSIDLNGGKEQQLEHILLDQNYHSLLSQRFQHASQRDIQRVSKVFALFDELDVQFPGENQVDNFLLKFMLEEWDSMQLNEPPKEAVKLAILMVGVSLYVDSAPGPVIVKEEHLIPWEKFAYTPCPLMLGVLNSLLFDDHHGLRMLFAHYMFGIPVTDDNIDLHSTIHTFSAHADLIRKATAHHMG
ncbi:uncharacterized protein HD556DRAFT_1308280 [Suillus plorans]|uniref:Uncharacterized protein n=1 Tax=Suillus plorans TaxID=116603 RepID=A0A9P7ARL6_9AGAM|nr:uncharacterized protein HD556DRAFT_1308280 [Suillus plorans]KAG1794231.1 hypothetical protein HD556DRAFT_1308280 [Suillus plorans]